MGLRVVALEWASEGVADDAQLVADLAAEEEQGDDGDNGDESKDECVFREALTCFLSSNLGEGSKDEVQEHGSFTSLRDLLPIPQNIEPPVPVRNTAVRCR